MRLIEFIACVLLIYFFSKTKASSIVIDEESEDFVDEKPEITYAVYVPKVVRPGFEIAFTAAIIDARNPVTVTAMFASSDREIEYQTQADVVSGSSSRIVLGSVPIGYEGSTAFSLTVTGTDSLTGEQLFSDKTKSFKYASKALTIMIQTDKAIYRPGETIRFRALCLTPDLKPVTGSISYQVQDPNDNIVLLEPNNLLRNGVSGGQFPLAKLAVQGDWKIVYEFQGYTETLPVSVEVYKLPKFEVKVDTVSFIHPGTQAFTVTLNADYTFGQPVKGRAKLTVEMKPQYGRSFPKKIITFDDQTFSGEASFTITKDQISNELGWNGNSEQKIEVIGFVTEGLTSITFNDTEDMDVKRHNVKLEVLSKPEVIKPGLVYQSLVRITEQDGKLLMNSVREKNKLIVEVTYRYNSVGRPVPRPFPRPVPIDAVAVDNADEEIAVAVSPIIFRPPLPPPRPTRHVELLVFDIPVDGIIAVDIEARNDDFSSVSFRAYTNATESIDGYRNQWTASRAESPSDSFIQITAIGDAARGDVTVGNLVEVLIRSNDVINQFRVMIIARGEILQDSTLALSEIESATRSTRHSFTATSEMTPSVVVLVYYVTEGNEIVADYITINIELALENLVSVASSSDNVDAGTNLNIRVQTSAPGSYVGIRAIDQSVLLLKSGNDITQERVVEDLRDYSETTGNSFRPFFYRFSYSSGARDATQVFEKAGIDVLTNALLYKFQPPTVFPQFLAFGGGGGGAGRIIGGIPNVDARIPNVAVAKGAASESSAAPVRVRNLFPETWLWDDKTTGADGSATFNTTAPDTITSWVISAFSMSDTQGLGIADTYKLTVFRKFFVLLNLPLKITRGEIIVIQATVFNYFDEDLAVRLILQLRGSGIDLLRPGDDPAAAGPVRALAIAAGGAVSVKFPVRINRLGDVPIRVQATSYRSSDAVSRNVFVKPEGIEQCYSASALVDRPYERAPTTVDRLRVNIPSGIVPGSARANLHTYGNVLGSTMSNLGRLLRTPSGCGEQNMLGFAPDVFVTLYLDAIDQLDDETRQKAYQHFTDGYQNELKFKHPDGSFSAFGVRDGSGSTWLTAFVAKCFIFADQLRPELVETKIIEQAIEFLASQQTKNGSFNEPGRVIHTEMQGRVDSPITMTAYVLITMTEMPFSSGVRETYEVVRKAREYLESNLDRISTDAYVLSLVTYALHVSESTFANRALAALNALATEENGLKYWHQETEGVSSYSGRWRPPYRPAPSNDIEMTAYALLTYSRRDDIASAIPILKWLVSKQNDLGGYSSTQDTVIAIQALSTVARLLSDRPQDLLMSVTHTGDRDFRENFQIDAANAIVYNTRQVTAANGDLIVRSEGTGIGIAQLSVCYNIPTTPYDQEPFACTVNIQNPNNNIADIEFCCSLRDSDAKATGMFLFEIGLLNGFSVDLFEEEERNKLAAMVEVDDDSVNVYYDQLVPGRRLCANVQLKRFAEVGSSKPATISAFEYYKPDKKVTRQYNVDGLSNTGPCDICGSDCVGCPAPMLSDWKPWSPCRKFCGKETVTRQRNCFDPSLMKNVQISKCGLAIQPIEERTCPNTFSCPTLSDGLWYDLPSHFSNRYFRRTCYYRTNRGKYSQRSPRTFIPGSMLNGNNEYLQCYGSRLHGIVPSEGFTISLLVKPNSFQASVPATIVAIGENSKRPVAVFEKLWWTDKLRLTVSAGLRRYYARNISLSALPTGVWSHVVLTWNEDAGAKVYINGKQLSIARTFRLRSFHPYQRNLQFYIGKNSAGSTTEESWRHGFLSGAVSAFNFWPNIISSSEVDGLSNFYEEITGGREEPELSVRHLRDFAPLNLKDCFNEPSTLSEVYAGRNGICKGEEQPNFIGRPIAF